MDLSIEHIQSFDQLAPKRNAWNELLASSDADPLFMSYEWVERWWHYLGPGRDLHVFMTYHDEQLTGIIPLAHTRQEGFEQLVILGEGRSDYQDFILHPDHAEAVVEAFVTDILPTLSDWDLFRTTQLVDEKETAQQMQQLGAGSRPWPLHVSDYDVAPYLDIRGSWEAYQQQGIKKKIAKDTQRQRRRLDKDFQRVEVLRAEDEDQVRAWFPELVAHHKFRRQDVKGDYSMFNEDRFVDFYREVALAAVEKNRLHFTGLKVDDDLAALHLGFLVDNTLYYLLPVMNWDYQKYSVSRVLLFELLQEAFANGYDVFDFGYGDEPYKHDFTAERKTLKEVSIFNESLRGTAARLWFTGVRRQMKQNTFFMETVLPRLKASGWA